MILMHEVCREYFDLTRVNTELYVYTVGEMSEHSSPSDMEIHVYLNLIN